MGFSNKKKMFIFMMIFIILSVSIVQPVFALDKWGSVNDMFYMAMGAGFLLIYNTVWQVNNSVNGLVGDAHAVYEAVKADITPKITDWWNGLSAEDQQAFTTKVQTDEDLMVSELLPQEIITDIVSESIGYGEIVIGETYYKNIYYPDVYINEQDYIDLQYVKQYVSDFSDLYMVNNIQIHAYNMTDGLYETKDITGWNELYVYEYNGTRMRVREVTSLNPYVYVNQKVFMFPDGVNKSDVISITEVDFSTDYSDGTEFIVTGSYEYKPASLLVESQIVSEVNYNPDDQQLDPFYYPVNNLKMADVWDIGTATDSDLQADTAIYSAVESETWDTTAGVAESAIAIGLQGDTVIDNDTGLPFALGAVKPWEVTASESTDTITDTTEDISSQSINWEPLTGLGQMLLDRFPFCIPFDIYALISKLASGERVAPQWTVNLMGEDMTIKLDMLDPVMPFVRTIELIVMVFAWYLFISSHLQES